MNFTMSMELATSRDVVWRALTDVAQVSQCIPDCEEVVEVGRLASYTAVIRQKIGIFKIEVPAEIAVEEVTEPALIRTRAFGRDRITGTTVSVVLSVGLEEGEAVSLLTVDAEMEVQGRLASLGFGMIKRRAEQNFQVFEERLKALLGAEVA